MGCNPTILAVHELYIRAFHILNDFPEILSNEDVVKYDGVLKTLLEDHKDVIGSLAQGFKVGGKMMIKLRITSDHSARNARSTSLTAQSSRPSWTGLSPQGTECSLRANHTSVNYILPIQRLILIIIGVSL